MHVLLLFGRHLQSSYVRNNGDALLHIHKVDKRFNASCFIVQIFSSALQFFQLAKIHHLVSHAMPLFQQPQVMQVNVFRQ